ncbi:hypothetical protein [Pseudochelatococcus contaminans]|uniref:Uncharacterized protein n=1 Tax=Pseudochelatococcus contaminans TaxID=1538103 RepID=A0A7W5Z4V3_9HYPH|nr:hypothetical protein [Pseudochelatococcus contaminans]MBB3810103.1 hypothetical protein [Pseudochelatococcus contaminans]
MTFAARLMVERGSIRDKSQDWGEYTFVSLPSPGDRIAADYDGAMHYLTVICVHHRPVHIHSDADQGGHTSPSAEVVAKWTSSD